MGIDLRRHHVAIVASAIVVAIASAIADEFVVVVVGVSRRICGGSNVRLSREREF